MKLVKLKCSNCDGFIELQFQNNQKTAFCPYCGQKYLVDDGVVRKEYTHNYNINKNINIKKTERYINDAEIIRESNRERVIRAQERLTEAQANKLAMAIGFPLIGLIMTFFFIMVIITVVQQTTEAIKKEEAGLISPLEGYYSYMWDNYIEVEADFKNAGFTNIKLVDLDDASFFQKENTVSKITIGGESEFDTDDNFSKDAEVVIYYH